jgi:hypothetical protein
MDYPSQRNKLNPWKNTEEIHGDCTYPTGQDWYNTTLNVFENAKL